MVSLLGPKCQEYHEVSWLFVFEQVFRSLVEITRDINGAKVENNKFCVSVHYRNVDEKVGVCSVLYNLRVILRVLFQYKNEYLCLNFKFCVFQIVELDNSCTMCARHHEELP